MFAVSIGKSDIYLRPPHTRKAYISVARKTKAAAFCVRGPFFPISEINIEALDFVVVEVNFQRVVDVKILDIVHFERLAAVVGIIVSDAGDVRKPGQV